MLNLEWRHFRLIQAIRDNGSLTAAAQSVGLTQPAATHQIKEAERRIGTSLVRKQGRHLQLSEAGNLIAETAEQCSPILMRAESQARNVGHENIQRLRIAFGLQDDLRWAACVAQHIMSGPQPIQLDLINSGSQRPTQILRHGLADMAIEIGESHFSELKRLHLGDDELVCLLSPDHPLAGNSTISAADISENVYLAHSLAPLPGFELETVFRPAGQYPKHVAQVQSLAAIKQMIAANLGVSIQPLSVATSKILEGSIIARPLTPQPLYQPWYLHWREEVFDGLGPEAPGSIAAILSRHITSTEGGATLYTA